MKFVVNRDLFTRALARIQGVLSRKASMQVLSNVLLTARPDGRLQVAATDLDITFDSMIAAEVIEPGRITIDGKRLYDVVKSMPGEQVNLAISDEDRVALTCQNTEFVLHTTTAEKFPTLPTAEGTALSPVDGTALRELIERTSFSVSTDESRPSLNGVQLCSVGGNRLRMVSTDGHRLSRGERDAGRDAELPQNDGVIIPRKGVGELRKLLDEVGKEVEFGFVDNMLVVAAPSLTLFIRLIDAEFPEYTQVIPKSSEKRAITKRLPFLAALQRIGILASERTHGVRIEISEGVGVLLSDNPDLGRAREEIIIEGYTGEPMTIAFNARYVQDILRILSAEKVEMALNEALSPGLFREHGNDDYLFVVMPMRI